MTPRLGLVVAPRDGLALKALYGRAFRAPSVFETRGDGADIGSNISLRPEIIDTFELVALHQTARYRVQLTGFASIWNEAIILVPIAHPSFTTTYDNAGRNRAMGVEASAFYARGGFRADASVSYVSSRNENADVDYGAFPTFIGNLGVGYSIEKIHLRFYLFQRLQVGMTEGDPVSNESLRVQPSLPPYYRADLNIEWEQVPQHFTLFLNLRNALALTNTVPSLANAQYGAPTQGVNLSLGARGGF
jgi:outer membrane receptor protein involved in Fe transport